MPSIPPGPTELGRSVVVSSDRPVPAPWAGAPLVVVDQATLEAPGAVVDTLHAAWADRRPVCVVQLGVETDRLRARQRCDEPPYALTPAFELELERLQFLVWANAYDARGDEVIWWHGRKAARRFADAGVRPGDDADIELADGTPVFVDGGPSHPPRLVQPESRSSIGGMPRPGRCASPGMPLLALAYPKPTHRAPNEAGRPNKAPRPQKAGLPQKARRWPPTSSQPWSTARAPPVSSLRQDRVRPAS